MRRLFAATFAVSFIGVLLVGGVLAWSAALSTAQQTVKFGALKVALQDVKPTGNSIYPTGTPIPVLTGKIANNTPKDPGIAVHVTRTSIGLARQFGCLAGTPPVLTVDFGASQTGVATIRDIPAGGGLLDWTVSATAPAFLTDGCQGVTENFAVTFDLST